MLNLWGMKPQKIHLAKNMPMLSALLRYCDRICVLNHLSQEIDFFVNLRFFPEILGIGLS
jgi:hypothetical protein